VITFRRCTNIFTVCTIIRYDLDTSTVDVSKLCCNDYPALVWYWKSTGKDLCNRGTISDRGLDIEFEAQTDRLSIEFKVLRENQKLQVILWGLNAGHQVVCENASG
jgi:hypothetical protein